MKDAALVLLALLVAGLATRLVRTELRRRRRAAGPGRILLPFTADGPSEPALAATLRLARAERATLVPAYLATVPLLLPLDAPLPRQVEVALPLLEAVEQRAVRDGVRVDARIERGRTVRHALRELLEHEPGDRLVVAAGRGGFDAADVAWLLERAAAEVLVLRPAGAATPRPARATGAPRPPRPSPPAPAAPGRRSTPTAAR